MFKALLACTNILRQIKKNMIALAVCAVMVCFLCVYIGNIQSNQIQLDRLSDTIPVTARITNLIGSKSVGLHINGSIPESIETSGFAENFIYTVQVSANFAPEAPEDQTWPTIRLAGTNTLTAFPSIQDIQGRNIDTGLFESLDAQCVVKRSFLESNGLSAGDKIDLAIYRWSYAMALGERLSYEYLGDYTLTITDSFELHENADVSAVPDIIVPIGWVKLIHAENGAEFFADSVSFSVKNPEQLNEFKAAMKELNLLSVNPMAQESVAGNALIVNDETYVRSATGIRSNLLMLRMFFPILLASLLASGYVVSNLIFQSRRGEYAIMRSLGMGRTACLAVFMGESAVLAAVGGLFGAVAALLLTGVSLSASALSTALFFVAYMTGVFVSVYTFSRISVIVMLSKAD